jgi:hypothetical protein
MPGGYEHDTTREDGSLPGAKNNIAPKQRKEGTRGVEKEERGNKIMRANER